MSQQRTEHAHVVDALDSELVEELKARILKIKLTPEDSTRLSVVLNDHGNLSILPPTQVLVWILEEFAPYL